MKVIGSKIRESRKSQGLSQSELADGICTQATISLIEKKNKVPSIDILMQICDRLELNLKSVLITNLGKNKSILKNVENYFFKHDCENMKSELDKLDVSDLDGKGEKKVYYFYQGIIELFANKDSDKAIFTFTKVLSISANISKMYDIHANIFLSKAYLNKNAEEEAKDYIFAAEEYVSDKVFQKTEITQSKALIYKNISEVFMQIGEQKKAEKFAKEGIDQNQDYQTTYLLDHLFKIMSDIEPEELKYSVYEYAFADYYKNEELKKDAKQKIDKNK